MPFRFSPTTVPGVLLIEPKVFPDARGFFMETYKRSEFAANGINETFCQANQSRSPGGILRGLHYQKPPRAQAKLVRALAGEIYDVAVDIRLGSPSYGKWHGAHLSAENRRMLYLPVGFAHGFCVISEVAEIAYMTSEEYAPELEGGIVWDDPELNITWPVDAPQLNPRDAAWPRLAHAESNFRY